MTNINQQISPDSIDRTSIDRARIPPFAYVLTVCIGVIGSNSLALGPIAPEVARSLGTDVPSVMVASAAFGLGTAVSAIFLGRFIDRYGPHRILAAALLLLAAGLTGSALAPMLAFLVAAQLVVGVATGIALPSIYTLASVIAPAGRESETIGLVLTGWTLSMVAGVPLSAAIADFGGWRAVYFVVAVATLVACAAVRLAPVREGLAGKTTSPLAALGVRGAGPLLIACAAFMAAFYGVYAYIGEHLHAALGLPLSANGLVAVSYGFGFGAAALLDRLIDRFGAGRLLPLIFLVVAGVYAAMAAVSSSYTAMLVVVFFWGLANHFGLNVLIMRLTGLDPTRRGAIMGLNSGVTYLSLFLGTLGFGVVYGGAGFSALPLAAAGLMLVAAIAAALAPR
ncbi:MFS transporter [Ensifer sp. ENS07]|jgi:DHA1 family inner membrane transport protein|uniref:MFS transporter n=1 Tax=Ensifer adhaerens TaxID=106592 RepID=A0A9Q8Y9N1_ENSAD|nr:MULTISPECIES: MFS transporter [Ensifer]KSV68499.1 transporter [Sinorhizobium sp. GW3]MBD9555283.1 MFS transporter [Ensifer sp. ENS03]MBD9595684.1 MFS transporter [Ensifer sp. ENS05]MBD9634709.1 MFS transporter [Ensifer sp. ENS07]USJ23609.1 MFS transporter [Ensifer adhaerens]